MSAKFGYNIRTLANNNFLNNFKGFQFSPWEAETNYNVGDKVYNGGYRFIASEAGISGTIGPSSTISPVIDGTVSWIFLELIPETEAFKGNLYFFIGKLDEWDDINQIPAPDLTDKNTYNIFNDMSSLKRIEKSEMRLGIKLYPWNSSAIYSQYSPLKNPLAVIGDNQNVEAYEFPFYCVHNYDIFKCLNNNNGGISTTPPESIPGNTNVIVSADGYVWKYMGTIDVSDYGFITSDYAPVKYLITDDGSAQWDIQTTTTNNGISSFEILDSTGTINPLSYTIKLFKDDVAKEEYAVQYIPTTNITTDVNNELTNILALTPGADFTPNCVALAYNSTASGSGAYTYDSDHPVPGEGHVTISPETGEIFSITFIGAQQGINYNSNAKIVIIGRFNEDAVTQRAAVITPNVSGGSIISTNIVDGGAGYEYARAFVIPGIAANAAAGGGVAEVILAPKNGHGYNIVKELGANALIIKVLTSTDAAYFPIGETNAFRQFGIITDIRDKDGITDSFNGLYIGPRHAEYDVVESTLNKISKDYGDILYLSNFGKVIRLTNQSEKIKVTIIF